MSRELHRLAVSVCGTVIPKISSIAAAAPGKFVVLPVAQYSLKALVATLVLFVFDDVLFRLIYFSILSLKVFENGK